MNTQHHGRGLPARHPAREPMIIGSQQAMDAYYAGHDVLADWDTARDGTPIMRVRVIDRHQQIVNRHGASGGLTPARAIGPGRPRYVDYRPAPGTAEYVASRRPRFSGLQRTLIAVAVVLLSLAAVIWALSALFSAILWALPYVLGIAVVIFGGSFLLSLIGPRGGGGGGGGGGGINITQSVRIG